MSTVLAWVATYLVHSTILILGAWLLERRWRDRPERMSAVWKVALVGGVATASLQMVLSISPLAGVWDVAPASGPAVAEDIGHGTAPSDEPLLAVSSVEAVQVVPAPRHASSARTVIVRVDGHPVDRDPTAVASAPSTPASASTPGDSSLLQQLAPWLIGGISLGALIGLFSIIGALAVLRQRLQGRQRLEEGSLVTQLERFRHSGGLRRKVALAVAPGVRTPMAVGILRPEIVLPREAAEALTVEQQAGLLAHELAHVIRHDPLWRIISLVVERVLFVQPLNRLASQRISTFAEYLCDDWAAQHTQAPLDLARCLTEVARWVAGPPVVAATMVGPRSILGSRVQRLIRPAAPSNRPRWLALPLGGLLLAMLLVAPNVSARRLAAVDDARAPAAVPAVFAAQLNGGAQTLAFADAAEPTTKTRRKKRSPKKATAKRKSKAKARKRNAPPKNKATATPEPKPKVAGKSPNAGAQAYRVHEDGSVEEIDLDDELVEVLENLEELEGLGERIELELEGELEGLEALEALGELEGLQALSNLRGRNVEVQLEALKALEVVDAIELSRQVGIAVQPAIELLEVIEDGDVAIVIGGDGDEITIEIHDERSARDKARSRRQRRKRTRKHRRARRR